MKRILVWHRRDLRIEDNPALLEASLQGEVIPVFIWAPKEEKPWEPGFKSSLWLYHSLKAFDQSLKKKKSRLIIRSGSSLKELQSLIQETGAQALFWNRLYEPAALKRDLEVQKKLEGLCEIKTFNASLLVEPWELATKSEKPFQVFTPFWKTALKKAPFFGCKSYELASAKSFPTSLDLEDLKLPDEQIIGWIAGEEAAQKKLTHFMISGVEDYENLRDRPDLEGVSKLSPHLHFGEIGPRQIWQALSKKECGEPFLRQLFWREFAHHLLFHFPGTPENPLRESFNAFPWEYNPDMLEAWKRGQTGYPFVDAGMRQLLETGWMHNRVRLIVASFLTKDLLIPWQEGAKWFWQMLVDADLANNTLGWQWTAGCGADAAPYFRIFNPISQGEKFDPEGNYIRKYVPELKNLAGKLVHKPWEASKYPLPIIDHAWARERALTAFKQMKERET